MNNHQPHMFTPKRMRPQFGSDGHPEPVRIDDQFAVTMCPDAPEHNPDQKIENPVPLVPRLSGSTSGIPDGWIDAPTALERLHFAGVFLNDRRVRMLCSREVLRSVKVKNERNQPQYFIDPASVEAYAMENGDPEGSRIIPPDSPDYQPKPTDKSVTNADPDLPNREVDVPEQKPTGQGSTVETELAVAKAQLEAKDEAIKELREDKRRLNDQLEKKEESNTQFRDYIMQLAGGTEKISKEMLETLRTIALRVEAPKETPQPMQGDFHDVTPDTHSENR